MGQSKVGCRWQLGEFGGCSLTLLLSLAPILHVVWSRKCTQGCMHHTHSRGKKGLPSNDPSPRHPLHVFLRLRHKHLPQACGSPCLPFQAWACCREQTPPPPQKWGKREQPALLPTRVTGALPQAHRTRNPSPLLINGKNVPRLSDGQGCAMAKGRSPPSIPPSLPRN
jgi:hypothetical protein